MSIISSATVLAAVEAEVKLQGATFTAVGVSNSEGKQFVNFFRAKSLGHLIAAYTGSIIGMSGPAEAACKPGPGRKTLILTFAKGQDYAMLEVYADEKHLEPLMTASAMTAERDSYPPRLEVGDNKVHCTVLGVMAVGTALEAVGKTLGVAAVKMEITGLGGMPEFRFESGGSAAELLEGYSPPVADQKSGAPKHAHKLLTSDGRIELWLRGARSQAALIAELEVASGKTKGEPKDGGAKKRRSDKE